MPESRFEFDRRRLLAGGARAISVGLAAPYVARATGLLGAGSGDPRRGLVDLTGALPIAGIPAPHILSRGDWGADESLRSGTPEYAPLSKIVLHHTATGVAADPAETVRAIYRHHAVTNGWRDIGYHFLVAPDGRIYEGRWARDYGPGEAHTGEDTSGNVVQGAHVDHYNRGTLGVALLGTFTSADPSEAALEGLTQLLAWVCDRHGLDPFDVSSYTNSDGAVVQIPTILGHRDVDDTSCPGNRFHAILQTVRERVGQTIANGFIGYRVISATGEAAHFGGARNYGDLRNVGVTTRVVGAAGTPNAQGYWMVDPTGAVYSFGAAGFFGSLPGLRQAGRRIGSAPVIGIAPTPSGQGYWLYDNAGGIFALGDATYHGSVPGLREAGTAVGPGKITAMTATPSGNGYWVLDEFGGVFAFGGAGWFGSVPERRRQGARVGAARLVSMTPTASGNGYWLLDEIGGVHAFGDAPFHGSLQSIGINDPPARRIIGSPSGNGYVLVSRSGAVYAFGDAPFHGRWSVAGLDAVDLAPVIRRR
ncbi:MAG: N-acetylmuramoyl-L-alanine amidase [Actinobacteria bacterium]|nr:N-acetylmuramoyl-L-alanine amidase [Actinomycetota bacterium]